MTGIIELKVEEVQENLDFCLTLCERGHTIKIIQQDKPSVLMVPVPEYVNNYAAANEELPDLPMPNDWQPDPVGVKQYVTEELSTMQEELNS